MKRFLMKLHDKIFGEPQFYAIYDLDGKIISLSAAALLLKFDSAKKPKAAYRYEAECIYADRYYFDAGWMVDNKEMGEFLTPAIVRVVNGKKFDRLFDEVFAGD